MEYFKLYHRADLIAYTASRYDLSQPSTDQLEDPSTVYAQEVEVVDSVDRLQDSPADYVLIGVPEDIGVLANLGREGARLAWGDFLKFFLNFPSNHLNNASRFCVLGELVVDDLIRACTGLNSNVHEERWQLSNAVKQIDERLQPVIKKVKNAGKIPVVIGGGHNNCLPIIEAFTSIDVLNIDAHTDLRPPKGRHSGNGFSHALLNGSLNKYFIYGVQENYLSPYMCELLDHDDRLDYLCYDPLPDDMRPHIPAVFEHLDGDNYGLEIDLDVIANFPSSAQNPVGFSFVQLRQLLLEVYYTAATLPKYLHFCEAAPPYGYPGQAGKALATLVNDLP